MTPISVGPAAPKPASLKSLLRYSFMLIDLHCPCRHSTCLDALRLTLSIPAFLHCALLFINTSSSQGKSILVSSFVLLYANASRNNKIRADIRGVLLQEVYCHSNGAARWDAKVARLNLPTIMRILWCHSSKLICERGSNKSASVNLPRPFPSPADADPMIIIVRSLGLVSTSTKRYDEPDFSTARQVSMYNCHTNRGVNTNDMC